MPGLSFYGSNPAGGNGNGSGAGNGVQYSTAQSPTGRGNFGYLTNDQVGTDQWGTGDSFQGAGRQAVLGALQGSMSNSNPLDSAGMDESRQYLRNTLADLPGMEANNISSFDTQAQRGLSNLLSQHAAGAAGGGTLGSRQYAGATGDITSRAGSDYMNGLIQARANALQQGLGITQGLEGIQSGDLAQRQFQLQQGEALAGGYEGLMGMDMSRQGQLNQLQASQDAGKQQMINTLIQGGATAGGAAIAGPPGAMAGSQLGGAATAGNQPPQPINTGSFYDGGNGGYSVGSGAGMYQPGSWNNGNYSGGF